MLSEDEELTIVDGVTLLGEYGYAMLCIDLKRIIQSYLNAKEGQEDENDPHVKERRLRLVLTLFSSIFMLQSKSLEPKEPKEIDP